MSSARAKRIVLVALVVAGGTATARELIERGKLPSVRVPLGAFVAGTMLAGLAEFAPDLAATFALVALVTALLVSVDTFGVLARILN